MIFWNHGKTPPIGKVTSVEMLSEGIRVRVEMEVGMLWRAFNKKTGQVLYEDTKERAFCAVLCEESFKTVARKRTYLEMAEILSNWTVTRVRRFGNIPNVTKES